MKTERDLFNGWLKHYEKHDVVIDQLQRAFMWQAWQASAQREGYKLVPLEMHWHKADELASAEWDKNKALFCSVNRDMTAIQVEDFRLRWCKIKANKIMSEYKAIIGLLNE